MWLTLVNAFLGRCSWDKVLRMMDLSLIKFPFYKQAFCKYCGVYLYYLRFEMSDIDGYWSNGKSIIVLYNVGMCWYVVWWNDKDITCFLIKNFYYNTFQFFKVNNLMIYDQIFWVWCLAQSCNLTWTAKSMHNLLYFCD